MFMHKQNLGAQNYQHIFAYSDKYFLFIIFNNETLTGQNGAWQYWNPLTTTLVGLKMIDRCSFKPMFMSLLGYNV